MRPGARPMKIDFGRHPLGSVLAAAVLAGCAGSQPSVEAPMGAVASPQGVSQFPQGVDDRGSWTMYTDSGYPQAIVRLQEDYWVANGYMSGSLSRITPKGK